MYNFQPNEVQIESLVQFGIELAFESNKLFEELRYAEYRDNYYALMGSEIINLHDAYKNSLKSDLDRVSSMAGFLLGPGSIGGEALLIETYKDKEVASQTNEPVKQLRDADDHPYK
jgi:hypothetical protein